MIEVASLRYGVIFKKAFSQVDIFKAFVRDTLGVNLEITEVRTKKDFDNQAEYVQPYCNLYAEDKKNRIIVNIQHESRGDHYERFLYSHGVELLEKIQKSTHYPLDFSIYTLVVLTSSDKYKKDVLTIRFDPCDLTGHYIQEIPHKIVFLCPRYANEKTPKPLNQWLEAIEDCLDGKVEASDYQHPEILKLFSIIQQNNISDEEEILLINEYHLEKQKKTQFTESLQLKEQQYIEKGKLTEKLNMAITMLQEDFEINIIAKITGLENRVILALKNKL